MSGHLVVITLMVAGATVLFLGTLIIGLGELGPRAREKGEVVQKLFGPRAELKVSLTPCGHWARLKSDTDEDGVWFANPYMCPTCGECPVNIDQVQDAFMENEELAEVGR